MSVVEPLSTKVTGQTSATLLKMDFNNGAFLEIHSENHLCRKSAKGCFLFLWYKIPAILLFEKATTHEGMKKYQLRIHVCLKILSSKATIWRATSCNNCWLLWLFLSCYASWLFTFCFITESWRYDLKRRRGREGKQEYYRDAEAEILHCHIQLVKVSCLVCYRSLLLCSWFSLTFEFTKLIIFKGSI